MAFCIRPLPEARDQHIHGTITDSCLSSLYDWVPSSTLLQNPSAIETEAPNSEASETQTSTTVEEAKATSEPEFPKADEQPKEPGSSTSSSKVALPSEWPSSIVPQQSDVETEDGASAGPVGLADAKTAPRPADTSLISILLTKALSWSWLLAQSDASAQVFAYMPALIAKSLKIDESLVTTVSLEAWEPPGWNGDGAEV